MKYFILLVNTYRNTKSNYKRKEKSILKLSQYHKFTEYLEINKITK